MISYICGIAYYIGEFFANNFPWEVTGSILCGEIRSNSREFPIAREDTSRIMMTNGSMTSSLHKSTQ